jgi:hypothetical protein
MQLMMIYWQSIVPQHVSGVFTPIIRRSDCKSLSMLLCPGCRCCGSGESGSEMCQAGAYAPARQLYTNLYKKHPFHSARISLLVSPEPQQ